MASHPNASQASRSGRLYTGYCIFYSQRLTWPDPEPLTSETVNRRVWFSVRDFIPGNNDVEFVCQVHLIKHVATPALAGRGGNRDGDSVVVETPDQFEDTWNHLRVERGFLEEFVLTVSIFPNLLFGKLPQEMTQNLAALSSIENEVQFGFRYLLTDFPQKGSPRCPVRRVTVDNDAVHVEDHGT
jgi:hypothetical protein